ncbi:DUF3613 domain-containing protein [Orrella sp. JC864]|uniref:DUF3613 domain-containing protein n=1 Tax=Orrella sp. JC864 TaxID=3120298 RepID=UPI00300AD2B9
MASLSFPPADACPGPHAPAQASENPARAFMLLALAAVLACCFAPAQAQNVPLTQAVPGPAAPPAAAQAVPVPAAPAASPATGVQAPQGPAAPARPVVSQVAAPAPQPAPAASGAPARPRLGDVTRLLLAAQADGRRAGTALPMLGASADLAWQRYMDSFTLPLPQWFDERVDIKE